MNVFLTGATGYIGSAVADSLIARGHTVVGLARSPEAADRLRRRGIEPAPGDLDRADRLASFAEAADAIVHTAFQWGADVTSTIAAGRVVVATLMSGIARPDTPFVFTSGTSVLGDTGALVYDESTPIEPHGLGERLETEQLVLRANGCRGIVIRPPNVYGRGDGQALFASLRQAGRRFEAIPFPEGAGDNLWSFVHVDDLAELYGLAVTRAGTSELFHAGAQSGLSTRDIAAAISRGTGWDGRTIELPTEELGRLFPEPALAAYWACNSQSSREKAMRLLGWNPRHRDMLGEISNNRTPANPGRGSHHVKEDHHAR